MADESTAETPPPAKSKKTMIVIAAILALEAVVIVGAMKFLGGGPATVSAVDVATASAAPEERIVEVLVLEAKLPNNKSGVAYLYPVEIYAQVKQRHLSRVKSEIEQFQNEMKADITAIWRSAEPSHFQEPRLENLTRKIFAMLNERFGADKATKEPVVSKVVIVMSTGFRIDS